MGELFSLALKNNTPFDVLTLENGIIKKNKKKLQQ
jgi:hypothetical protein